MPGNPPCDRLLRMATAPPQGFILGYDEGCKPDSRDFSTMVIRLSMVPGFRSTRQPRLNDRACGGLLTDRRTERKAIA
jgi:hypothetical protein